MKWIRRPNDDEGELSSVCGTWIATPTGAAKCPWIVGTYAIDSAHGRGSTPDAALANWAVENRNLAARLNALADAAEGVGQNPENGLVH